MRPLLIFPKPANLQREMGIPKFPPPPRIPGHQRQTERLTPKFDLLQKGFRESQFQNTPEGYAPERTLVMQTVGSISGFANACAKIPGLEFVSEALADDLEADDDFWLEDDKGKRDKPLTSYVYMAMSNQEGINQLLRYWERYKQDEQFEFPLGLAPLKQLFKHLHEIRYWDTEDRLRDTGLLEDWQERVEHEQGLLPVEIELWFRENSNARNLHQSRLESIVRGMGGQIQSSCCLPEIGYHALLAQLPTASVADLLNNNSYRIDLLRCDEIWYFRPVGQCLAPVPSAEEPSVLPEDTAGGEATDISNVSSLIALLDGLPLQNHIWLQGRLIVDDPDGWAENYPASDRQHGTAMASLIIHGDRNAQEAPLSRPVYVRPIMQPNRQAWRNDHQRERIPEELLPVDLIHRAVRRLFEGDGQEGPVAPSIKIINLSIGDPNRLFDKALSPLARLIDWLSYKYQVLFVISAGNHSTTISLDVNTAVFNTLTDEEKEKLLIDAMMKQRPHRRLFSPAEAVNAITVGAAHDDEYQGEIHPSLHDLIASEAMPSPLNPLSWGKHRSVKPDILMPGGKVVYANRTYQEGDVVTLAAKEPSGHPPGQLVAAPTNQPGNINGSIYSCGTSNAAVLATRRLALLHDTLQDLYYSEYNEYIDRQYEAVLLKAMLVHGAEIHDDFQTLRNYMPDIPGNVFRAHATRFTGYGLVNCTRIHGCTDNQATILQCGTIGNDRRVIYELPLPACLNAKAVNRRLIITLAWLSPTNPQHSQYRQARLSFSPVTDYRRSDNPLALEKRAYDHNMVRKGTVQHEVLFGDRAKAYSENDSLKIEIECMGAAGAQALDVPYGLVVTLDSLDVSLPIYEQVKAGLDIRFSSIVSAQQKVRT